MSKFSKHETEFLDALERIGFSKALCESINDIRSIIFETGPITNKRDELLYDSPKKQKKHRTSGKINNDINGLDSIPSEPEEVVKKISKIFGARNATNGKASKYTTSEDGKALIRFSNHHPSFKYIAEFVQDNQQGDQPNYEKVICITFFKNKESDHQTEQKIDDKKYQLDSIPQVKEFTFFIDEMKTQNVDGSNTSHEVTNMVDFLRGVNSGLIPAEFLNSNNYMTYKDITDDLTQYINEVSLHTSGMS